MENQENKLESQKNFEQKKSNLEAELISLTSSLKDIEIQLTQKNYIWENEISWIEFKKQLSSLIKNLDKNNFESQKSLDETDKISDFKTEILNLQLEILSSLRQDEFVKSNPSLQQNIQNSIETFANIVAKKNKEKIIFDTKKSIPEIVNFYWPAWKLVKKIFEKSWLYNS